MSRGSRNWMQGFWEIVSGPTVQANFLDMTHQDPHITKTNPRPHADPIIHLFCTGVQARQATRLRGTRRQRRLYPSKILIGWPLGQ